MKTKRKFSAQPDAGRRVMAQMAAAKQKIETILLILEVMILLHQIKKNCLADKTC
jgi:hypothetical protein